MRSRTHQAWLSGIALLYTRKIWRCLPKHSETLETNKNQDRVIVIIVIIASLKVQNVFGLDCRSWHLHITMFMYWIYFASRLGLLSVVRVLASGFSFQPILAVAGRIIWTAEETTSLPSSSFLAMRLKVEVLVLVDACSAWVLVIFLQQREMFLHFVQSPSSICLLWPRLGFALEPQRRLLERQGGCLLC